MKVGSVSGDLESEVGSVRVGSVRVGSMRLGERVWSVIVGTVRGGGCKS